MDTTLSARGTWLFSGEHPLFRDHFPGAPRLPGSLLIEAMRAEATVRFPGWRIVGVHRFQFRQFVEPGEYAYTLELQPETAHIRCTLLAGERCMARGTLLAEATGCPAPSVRPEAVSS